MAKKKQIVDPNKALFQVYDDDPRLAGSVDVEETIQTR